MPNCRQPHVQRVMVKNLQCHYLKSIAQLMQHRVFDRLPSLHMTLQQEHRKVVSRYLQVDELIDDLSLVHFISHESQQVLITDLLLLVCNILWQDRQAVRTLSLLRVAILPTYMHAA